MIDFDLYWMMPGPRNFIHGVSSTLADTRLVVINTPSRLAVEMWHAVDLALRNAQVDRVMIGVQAGSDIASQVGVAFHSKPISGVSLSRLTCSHQTAVCLRVVEIEPMERVLQYAFEFSEASKIEEGNAKLLIEIHDSSLRSGWVNRGELGALHVFDGGLTRREMSSYVSLRMDGRDGPGSTSLLSAIVSEFSGFDVVFAEELMNLGLEGIISLPATLADIDSQSVAQYRRFEWLDGTLSNADPRLPHALHDFYLSLNGTQKSKQEASKRLEKRYWRACVAAIMPWLEARRESVLACIAGPLKRLDQQGRIVDRFTGRRIDPMELEYNEVVGLANHEGLAGRTPTERRALEACRAAKCVRDQLSHLRVPAKDQIISLIQQMDALPFL